MPVLEILTYPDPRLKKKSSQVKKIDDTVLRLLDDMAQTMYDAPGVGLAAPQVGYNLRVIVVDVEHNEEGDRNLIELINPEIIVSEGKMSSEEACLSIPGFTAEVKRKSNITVEGLNRYGKKVRIEAAELLARVFQHEIDHLDGILFVDRLSRLKRELLKKKIKKAFSASG
jgi:peptide deformylase